MDVPGFEENLLRLQFCLISGVFHQQLVLRVIQSQAVFDSLQSKSEGLVAATPFLADLPLMWLPSPLADLQT